MGNRLRLQSVQISDSNTPEYELVGKVTKIIIRNLNTSAETLYVGLNESANPKIQLDPGESLTLDAQEGYYDGNILRFAFAATNVANYAFLITETEQEKPVC